MPSFASPLPQAQRATWPISADIAVGLLLGVLAAVALTVVHPLWLVALALCGVAFGGRRGWVIATLALGVLLGWSRWQVPEQGIWRAARDRPVTAEVVTVGHATVREAGEQTVPVRLLRLRQEQPNGASWVVPANSEVILVLPDEQRIELGETLRVRGGLRRAQPTANPGVSPRPGPWRLRVKSWRLVERLAPPGPLGRLSAALRARLEVALSGRSAGLDYARAMVIGDATRLAPELRRDLRRCGLTHVLSVSGVHLAMLVVVVALLTSCLGRAWQALAVIAAALLYVLAVGPQPALLRSAAMAVLAVLALLSRRPPLALHALALAVVGLLLSRPALVSDLGFALTAAATAGLVLGAGPLAARWGGVGAGLSASGNGGFWRRPLAASVSAQLATLPITLPLGALLVPASPLINMVMVPWTGVLLAGSFAWTLLALVAPDLAGRLTWVLDAGVVPLDWLAVLPAAPWWLWPISLGAWGACVLTAFLAAVAWWPRRLAPVGLILVGLGAVAARPASDPELVMLDVGQGDAILLRDGHHAALVDGGGWSHGDLGARVLVPALTALGVKKLELAVVSHGDQDHCGGLLDLTSYLPIARFAVGAGEAPARASTGTAVSGNATCLSALTAAAGERLASVAPGDRFTVGRIVLTVLSPPATSLGGDAGSDNERSLVLEATVGRHQLLLMGDAGLPTERRLLASWGEQGEQGAPSGGVLKVGHHGSRSATSAAFLATVQPRLALISAGPSNPFGHPSRDVLERLAAARALVLRTDLHGQVRLRFAADAGGAINIDLPAYPRP